MDKKGIVTAFLLAAGLLGTPNVQAQRTYEEMEQLTVNEQVTTVITASEPVRLYKKGKEKEVITFFVSDDKNHLPIRLDMYLNFGSAKAFLKSVRGNRYPMTSVVTK